MNVKIISCWFATSYGAYTDGLRRALERRLGCEVGIIATNCGCDDPMAVQRRFQDRRCEYFELPNVRFHKSTSPLKYWLRTQARSLVCRERARQFHRRDGAAEVLHFQQILNATGSATVFHWLRMPSRAARVVTVHELDPYQLDFPESNLQYNRADRIIVHFQELKDSLCGLGVDGRRIDVVQHGVEIRPPVDGPREGIIFYGGHHLESGKGFNTLLEAMRLVKQRLGARAPRLTIHGHYGAATPGGALRASREGGLGDDVRWLNEITLDAAVGEYQRALLCVLPYTGSFAGYAAGLAMAHGAAVIGTRRAGLPDHVGDAGRFVAENGAGELAEAIVDLLGEEASRRDLAARGRARAEAVLGWDPVAARTLDSYRHAIELRAPH
ncbi:MAG: glycosyltransferase family 4 protein [Thermoguttaceae bacterium]